MKNLFIISLLFIVIGGSVGIYGMWVKNKQDAMDHVYEQEYADAEKVNNITNAFNVAKTVDELSFLESEVSTLPKGKQEELLPQIKLKIAMLKFSEAESILNRARELQAALTIKNIEQRSPPIHPAAMKLLDQATLLYNESKKEVDRLSEVKNSSDYNFRLNYIKGEVYHRYTQLFATQETAKELFNQTVTFYKQALRYKPADTNTVVNIELLIKDEQGMTGGVGQPQQQKSKLLNQQAGQGHSTGN